MAELQNIVHEKTEVEVGLGVNFGMASARRYGEQCNTNLRSS